MNFERLALHAMAQINPAPGKCWGKLSRCLGYCLRNARPGKLTCWHHQFAESQAQRLKAAQEQQGS